MKDRLLAILSTFEPITLQEMDSVKLMTRNDTKYTCHITDLAAILETAATHYQVLEIGGKRLMGYESQYYDTPDHQMYIRHHNRNRNRHKIRIRKYLNSGDHFLEVKFKKNTGTTEKTRIPVPAYSCHELPECQEFISRNTPYESLKIEPKLFSNFQRITLVNTAAMERITIDIEPNWYFNGVVRSIPYLVIMEVKAMKFSNREGFGWILREARIKRKRLSKYCTGTMLLYPELKRNRFKTKLLHLKKLDKTQEYADLFTPLL